MSGHSKWSKVKHQKATTDVVKSAAFTKAAHAITIAVREGGGISDPNMNFHLRLAVERARAVNMPKENIQRAMARAAGEGAAAIAQVQYEAYGPGGVAFLIEAATDNRQRSVSQVKNVLERAGGTLASPGAVSFQFRRRGVLTVPRAGQSLDAVLSAAIEGGADDVAETEDFYEVYTADRALFSVKKKLEEQRIPIDNAVLIMYPTTTVVLDKEKRETTEKLVGELSQLEDVQTVYTNVA
ncbi:MAG: transcriptional regulator [Microgenomates group bacterium GW2011_GWC1_49_7]|nr:MAG: transcriptional regulator [Microgenomates group bacterium GW2011_GWC1_49_7]